MDKTRNQFNKKFIERMRQAANRARVLGDNALAEALNNEATDYEEAPVMTASDMYSRISDIAMDSEAATFEQVVDALAHEFGYTAPEITGKYPRLQQVFATEQRKWNKYRALRQARVNPRTRQRSRWRKQEARDGSIQRGISTAHSPCCNHRR